jgi:hypothetical protein
MIESLVCSNCGHVGPSVIRRPIWRPGGLVDSIVCADAVLCAHRWNLANRQALSEPVFQRLERAVHLQLDTRPQPVS